jgi:hypothetical protein
VIRAFPAKLATAEGRVRKKMREQVHGAQERASSSESDKLRLEAEVRDLRRELGKAHSQVASPKPADQGRAAGRGAAKLGRGAPSGEREHGAAARVGRAPDRAG